MAKMKRKSRKKNIDKEIWSEDEYDEYMASIYGLTYIAGYTDSGVPYGTSKDISRQQKQKTSIEYPGDELPF